MQIKNTVLAIRRRVKDSTNHGFTVVVFAGLLHPLLALAEPLEPLSRELLVTQVLDRNPKGEAAKQAWSAAEAHTTQTRALKDPVLALGLMPTTLSNATGVGQMASLSQALEWPGTRTLRQESAMANSHEKQAEYEQVELQLAWMAARAFENYTAIFRAMEVNFQNQKALQGLGQSAEAHYTSGHGAQSAPLQVQVELALLEKERISLEAQKDALAVQINGLLNQAPQTPLGTPKPRTTPATLPAKTLQDWIRMDQDHPALSENNAQINRAEKQVQLVKKSRMPSFVVSASTESMPHHERDPFMLGLALNLPLNQARHRALLAEGQAELLQAQALLAETQSNLSVDQQRAWLALEQAIDHARLYQDQILPTADQQLAATEAGYGAGREGFLDVLLAQRQRFRLELEHEAAIAESWKAQASLKLAFGELPDSPLANHGATQ